MHDFYVDLLATLSASLSSGPSVTKAIEVHIIDCENYLETPKETSFEYTYKTTSTSTTASDASAEVNATIEILPSMQAPMTSQVTNVCGAFTIEVKQVEGDISFLTVIQTFLPAVAEGDEQAESEATSQSIIDLPIELTVDLFHEKAIAGNYTFTVSGYYEN